MQFNTFAASLNDLHRSAVAPNLHEILLEPVTLARQGRLSLPDAHDLAQAARQLGLRPVLVWDVLLPERELARATEQLAPHELSAYAAVRVADVGAAMWLKQHHPSLPLQLIAETGNHNKDALLGWVNLFGQTLERLILSIELPEEKLLDYYQSLPVPCELLGVGQILLFYSPRSLLARHLPPDEDGPLYIDGTAISEKSSFKPFPVVETQHGTLMFLDKDQFILDRLQPLHAAGLHTVRLDVRHLSEAGHAATNIDQLCEQLVDNPTALRKRWPRPTRAPFFKANKTTAQFSRMRAKLHELRDERCVAEIIAAENGRYVVFHALRPFSVSSLQELLTPAGEVVLLANDFSLRTLAGQRPDYFETGQLGVSAWVKKASSGGLLRIGSGSQAGQQKNQAGIDG